MKTSRAHRKLISIVKTLNAHTRNEQTPVFDPNEAMNRGISLEEHLNRDAEYVGEVIGYGKYISCFGLYSWTGKLQSFILMDKIRTYLVGFPSAILEMRELTRILFCVDLIDWRQTLYNYDLPMIIIKLDILDTNSFKRQLVYVNLIANWPISVAFFGNKEKMI